MTHTTSNPVYLAFDFGAESGKAVAGSIQNKKLEFREIYRFPTGLLQLNDHYFWNVYRFYEEIIRSLKQTVVSENMQPHSIAFDTWGVDFGLLDRDGSLIRTPFAYRDPQGAEAMNDFHQHKMNPRDIYQLTGISMQPFNSLYQIWALSKRNDFAFAQAEKLLFMPDLLNYFLSGVQKTEFSFATTTQLFNPQKYAWEEKLLQSAGLNSSLLNDIVEPGEMLGNVSHSVQKQTGLKDTKIVSVCSHDTGSAIVAVPALEDNWAFISSGTWSLMGVETEKPVISQKAFDWNFSNEGIDKNRYRLLKNIMGIWILQGCKRSWDKPGNTYHYADLVKMAEQAKPAGTFIDPDDQVFFNPADMPGAIDDFCQRTNQQKPASKGEYVRVILESLALKYRMVLEQLTHITAVKIDKIHIIGGGIQNQLLCQYAANATGKTVVAGPVEGTALGNIGMQAKASGEIKSIEEIRHLIKNTFDLKIYTPTDGARWEKAYDRFRNICSPST
ncbi:MAG: rhamnulokinase [Bacteroidales bacterium]